MANSRCKFYKQVKQVTYDFGQTWTDTTEYRRGDIYEYDSSDCGLMERWVKTDNTMCQYWPDPTPPPSYSGQYLTLKANTTSGYVKLNNAPSTFQYSIDSGSTWTDATSADTIPMSTGGTMFKGTLVPSTTPGSAGIGRFSASTQFTAEGNPMSLLFGDNFSGQTSLSGKSYAFEYLFINCTSLVNAENMVLPATTLEYDCYNGMFKGCTNLTTAPSLPATTLAEWCYSDMFSGCISLTTAPALPATTLAIGCYAGMFSDCTSLTTAPALPATTLASQCYYYMFNGCISLTTALELPATTLANQCYENMFQGCSGLMTAPSLPATTLASECYGAMFSGCTSLTTAPVLSATTLAFGCYWAMFYGCSNLNYIKCLATNISASYCTDSWVNGVAANGTFVKNSSMSSWTTGVDGIPSGWTVQNA